MRFEGLPQSILDACDAPLRFVYCRLPFISRTFFRSSYRSNYQRLDEHFQNMIRSLARRGYSLRGSLCLEIGPGDSSIIAANLLLHGARKVYEYDKYPRKHPNSISERERRFLEERYGIEALEIINNNRVHFLAGRFSASRFPRLDFACSFSVLEHVSNVDAYLKELHDSIRPGGYMYHTIDMRDHFNFNSPFLFYKYSEKTWRKYLTREGVSYTNRIRYDDFVKMFNRHSFSIVEQHVRYAPLHPQQKIDASLRLKCKEVLEIAEAKFLLRRD